MTSPPKPPKQYDSNSDLPLGLVAMATESSRRLIMEKWLNCIFFISSEVM